MDWNDVKIFLAVARAGQFLGAARRLGVNHATAARRVSALEETLKTRLFNRRTTGCDLTEAGEHLLAHAERMETEMLSALSTLGDEDVAIAGTVRIGAPDGFGVSFLAPTLSRLITRHPNLKVQLVPVPRSFSLSRREADIVVSVDMPEQGRLVARKLVDYTLGLYANTCYLKEHSAPHTIQELSRHRLVGYVDDLVISPSLNYAAEISRDWQACLEISSSLGQFEAVKAGAGIGMLHTFIAQECLDLVPVLPTIRIERSYWLSYHESSRSLRRIKVVADFIAASVAAASSRFSALEGDPIEAS